MIRKIGVHLADLNGTELEVTFTIQCDPSGSALPEFLSFWPGGKTYSRVLF